MNTITKIDLLTKYKGYLTVGKLREILDNTNLPDNAKVLIERVEDKYYENHNWGVFINENSEYHPAWYSYPSDENLFIDLHY